MAETKATSSSTPAAAAAGSSSLAVEAEDLEKVFKRFDANGDGKISQSEMGGALRSLGSGASEDEVRRMMTEMDSNRDGFVDLKEFKDFVGGGGEGEGEGDGQQQLMDAFRTYDLDGNGRISAKELHLVMRRMGMKCSLGDCSRMIRSVDADGDGCVDFKEFKQMMTRRSSSSNKKR